jgi:peptidylprolyl isomerase
MPNKKGDFLLIEYIAKVKETGDVFDTTQEELAKEKRLYKEGESYEPKLVVIGEGWMLKALDDSLMPLTLNKSETVEIPPDQAFGSRDPEKVRMIPLRRLRDKGISPTIGLRIEYEKRMATVRTVGGGRVQLDFNPPLAGKTLVYEVTARKKLRLQKDKILALIHRRIPLIEIAKFKLEIEKTKTTIRVPEEAFYIEGLPIAKRGIAADIHRFFQTIAKVEFVESFKNPKVKKVSKKPSKKKAEANRKKSKTTGDKSKKEK